VICIHSEMKLADIEDDPETRGTIQTGTPTRIKIGLDHIPTNWDFVNTSSGSFTTDMVDWQEGSTVFTPRGDNESRPINMYLDFIIIKKTTDTDIPPGCVAPFGY
jgi:hypothetical protein